MNRLLKHFFFPKKPEQSLIEVKISKKNLLHNLHEFQKLNGSIAPVLKSNAYGHGILEIAQILETASVPFLVVDSYFEAHTLRYNDIHKPIFILGYTQPEIILQNTLKDISFVITSLEMLEMIALATKPVSIHVKIDTGMHRQGMFNHEISRALQIIKQNKNLILEGVCTHFSDADNIDKKYTIQQIKVWNEAVEMIKEAFPEIRYIHIANTAGHVYLNNATSNVSRLGIGLYGLSSGGEVDRKVSLKPVMSVETIITGIKHIKAGDSVGYSKTFTAKKDMTIATIPMGYFEGLDRRLSGCGYVMIDTVAVPLVGRVSMNISIIDVSKIADIKIGNKVLVVSSNAKDKNSIDEIAKKCKTISYVIAVHIERGLKRIVI